MTNPPLYSLGAGASIPQSPDITATGGQPPQPQEPTYYEKIQSIYNDAVRAAHMKNSDGSRMFSKKEIDGWVRQTASETFQGAHNFRTFDALVNTLQNLNRSGARPITEDDLSPLEKGAFARTALVGRGMTFGLSPYLSGLANVSDLIANPGDAGNKFRQGRAEANRYFRLARLSANSFGESENGLPGINPEPTGSLATSLLATGGTPLVPQGFLRGAATGAGLSLAGSLGQLPDLSTETLKNNAVPLAANTAIGAFLGGGSALWAKRLTALNRPGPLALNRALEATGGEEQLAQAIDRYGTARPMLAELRESTLGRMGRTLGLKSPEAATEALDRVNTELQGVRQAKQAVGARYNVLQAPIQSDRAAEIIQNSRVAKIAQGLVRDGVIDPAQPLTARALEDIRQELIQDAKIFARRGKGRIAKALTGYAEELRGIIDNSHPSMPDIRAQYAPLSARDRVLSKLAARLERSLESARGIGTVPIENKVTAHSEVLQELQGEPWQRAIKAARQNVGPLFTPGTAAEHANRIRSLMPWYSRMSDYLTPAASLVPHINPFFQQEPQQP